MIHRIAITPGEPAGIGPDLVVALAQTPHNNELVIIADPGLLRARAAQLGLPIRIQEFNSAQAPRPQQQGTLVVAPVNLPDECQAGELNINNAAYVLATLDRAIELCQQRVCGALVTGPINKSVINDASAKQLLPAAKYLSPDGFFSGHTEYLAAACQREKVVMMLTSGELRVALVTTHLPLAAVPAAITPDNVQRTIEILWRSLQNDFAIAAPRILVCGLNPHAGESGHLGREEIEVIIPVLEQLRKQGLRLMGPLPADTLFTPQILGQGDAVLAMYHDQGLPVLKSQAFGNAVNITLGLPIIRTSVDHGTALDLAGTGKAHLGSLQAALATAIAMATSRLSTTAAT